MVGAVNYIGLGRFLAPKLGRELTNEDRGRVSSLEDVDEVFMSEAKALADISTAYAVAYLRYTLSPRLVQQAGIFVEEVLIGDVDVNKWFEANMN